MMLPAIGEGDSAKKRLVRGGIAGQIVSLCLVGTSGSSALLARRGWTMPMLQSFLTYLCIGVFYSGLVLYRGQDASGIRGGVMTSGMDARMIGVFLAFAISDVEANFTIVKAYQFTNLTSVTLLDCFTIPCVVCLSAVFLGARYTWVHGAGVVTAVAGLILLVYTDLKAAEGEVPPPSPGNGGKRVLGDVLTLVAATLYAVSNIMQEHLTGIDDWRKVRAGP
uniref:EamA domain-containing protein n=1 Tax=Hemiselmis andersenii TaxID=464988 RepID=A0A7S1DH92_HEMAN|mmetsp:Transcript_12380/g.30196  ORF Transcript_12380/g.30196 Transcript_12380/m.30196 type:complete len:222 (+) Transcript_12380:143-808(+)